MIGCRFAGVKSMAASFSTYCAVTPNVNESEEPDDRWYSLVGEGRGSLGEAAESNACR